MGSITRRSARGRFLGLTALLTAATAAQAAGLVERVNVHGASLEGNLMNETAAPDVSIYLPPSYAEDTDRRYPVVYILHGYFGTDLSYFGDNERNLPAIADRVFEAGETREMILVMPNCNNAYRGCMYSNSATAGYWENYIADDLVVYMDAHYRTLADRDSRGLAGHSMGGYGTLRIGMKRPDAFSAIYAMSSCCLAELSPRGGEQAAALESVEPDEIEDNFGALGTFARAAAWAPNPDNPPYYFDMPTQDGVVRPEVAARWAANSPIVLLDSHVPYLKRLTAIKLDIGEQDGLIESNRMFSERMSAFGVEHEFETYEGDHGNRIAERLESEVLPFFSTHLAFE